MGKKYIRTERVKSDGHLIVFNKKGDVLGQIYKGKFHSASSPMSECWFTSGCLRKIANIIESEKEGEK
jgi:hypothetical protein